MVSFLSNQFPWTHMAGFMKRHFYCSASSWADSSTQRNRSSDGELTAGGGLIRTHIHSSRNADYIFCREYKQHQELHCCQLPGIICYFETRRLLAVKVNGYKVFFFFFPEQVLAAWLTSRKIWRLRVHNRFTHSVFTLRELLWELLFRFISAESSICVVKQRASLRK